jgi:polar amino acid transport system substrate-binding protein
MLALASLCALSLSAQTYKVALMDLPTAAFYEKITVEVTKAANLAITISKYPVARALGMVEDGSVDICIPQLVSHNQARLKAIKFDYSSDVIYKSAFVLYTNKNKPVDIAALKAGNKEGLKIETDLSNVQSFEFVCSGSTNLEASLQKVDQGKIDGFIFSQSTGDMLLKKLALKNVHRQLYDTFDIVFALVKGKRGGDLDKALGAGLAKIKANKVFDQVAGDLVKAATYTDWQP